MSGHPVSKEEVDRAKEAFGDPMSGPDGVPVELVREQAERIKELEITVGSYRDALQQIADGRPNKPFDPWSRELARTAIARTPIALPSDGDSG